MTTPSIVGSSQLTQKLPTLPTLGPIHPELTLHIFSFLSLQEVVTVLPLVCKSWRSLLDPHISRLNKMKNEAEAEDLDYFNQRYSEVEVCEMLCKLAVKNSKFAQRALLNLVEASRLKIVGVFYKIAKNENMWGQYCLGRVLSLYQIDKMRNINRCAQKGLIHAQFYLGKHYLALNEDELARNKFRSAADEKMMEAQFELSRICGDQKESHELLQLAAKQGHARAMLKLFSFPSLALKERFEWLIKAALSKDSIYYGCEAACLALGRQVARRKLDMLEEKLEDYPKEILEELDSLANEEKQAELGSFKKYFDLGFLFQSNLNEEKEYDWLCYCDVLSHDPNCFPFIIGLMYGLGVVFQKDDDQALKYFIEGIKQQDPIKIWRPSTFTPFLLEQRRCNLSFLNNLGKINDRPLRKILLDFLREKASSDSFEYQFIIGIICLSGVKGTTFKEGFSWIEKAAEKDYLEACFLLFIHYLREKDYKKAITYFQKLKNEQPKLKKIILKEFLESLKDDPAWEISETLISKLKNILSQN